MIMEVTVFKSGRNFAIENQTPSIDCGEHAKQWLCRGPVSAIPTADSGECKVRSTLKRRNSVSQDTKSKNDARSWEHGNITKLLHLSNIEFPFIFWKHM